MALNPDVHEDNAPDPSTLASSIYAAAHCAQSCIRFWNLLLQDTASVNPFGFSVDGYGAASDEEDQDDEENDFDVSEHDECVEEDTPLEDAVIDPYHAMLTTPRPESYMKLRTLHWWNHHVGFAREDDPNYADVFRLPVSFFTTVCGICREDMQQGDIPMPLRLEGRVLSVERQVAIAVMRLATGNTLKWISEHLGCALSTVAKILYKFVSSVRQRASQYLQWPMTEESLARVKDGFFQKHKLPNCCGTMDATHVLMELPSGEPADVWMNRSHTYSMVLQAVVDTDLRFLDVCVGYPGSLSDAKCIKESSLYRKCCSGQRLSGPFLQVGGDCFVGEYIVAGTEYPLLPWLMTPYVSHGVLAPMKTLYNDRLNSTKIAVARAFGRLKGTWRFLHSTMKQPNIERIPKMIHACCILHNMCIDAGGVEGIHLPESDVIVQHHDPEDFDGFEDHSYGGVEARENLCRALNVLE